MARSGHRCGLRTGHDKPRSHLAGPVHDGRFRAVHIQTTHIAQLLEQTGTNETFGRERAHGSVVARGADHDGGRDDVRVHARLRIVVERDERPVRDDARDALPALEVLADDEVLDGRRVHEDDVGHREDAREDGRGEQGCVLHDDEGAFVLERNTDLCEEAVCGLTDDLGDDEKGIGRLLGE